MFQHEIATVEEACARARGVLASLRQFDDIEVAPVIKGQLGLSQEEECRITLYLRTQMNVDSVLALENGPHYQALSMIARSLFELSVDVRLLTIIPRATERMLLFQRLEKLRAARAGIVQAREPDGMPASEVIIAYERDQAAEIEALANSLWPGKLKNVKHWSHLAMSDRATKIGGATKHLYAYTYKTMSWQTHAGVQGTYGLPVSAFMTITRSALNLASLAYADVLQLTLSAMKLEKNDPLMTNKLMLARLLPLTDNPEEQRMLRSDVGL